MLPHGPVAEHTIDAFVVGKGLSLLRFVPFNHESVTEGQGCPRVCGTGNEMSN